MQLGTGDLGGEKHSLVFRLSAGVLGVDVRSNIDDQGDEYRSSIDDQGDEQRSSIDDQGGEQSSSIDVKISVTLSFITPTSYTFLPTYPPLYTL